MPADSGDVVVTSFPPEAAETYGRHMVETFRAYWPASVRLIVYVDAPLAWSGVEMRQTTDLAGWLETRARLPQVSDSPDRYKPTGYLWNARKFAVKPFIWCDAAERMGTGRLTWLDGDTYTSEPVPDVLPQKLLGSSDVAFLGRGVMHPETGYVGFRVPEALPLLRWCRDAYMRGKFRRLREGWTDCHVLRAGLKAVPTSARDLTSTKHYGPWNSRVDAMALCPLGKYVTHLKGRRRKREAAI